MGNFQCSMCVTRTEHTEDDPESLVKGIQGIEGELGRLRQEIAWERAEFARVQQEVSRTAARRKRASRPMGKSRTLPASAAALEQQLTGPSPPRLSPRSPYAGQSPRSPRSRKPNPHRRDRGREDELPRLLDTTNLTAVRIRLGGAGRDGAASRFHMDGGGGSPRRRKASSDPESPASSPRHVSERRSVPSVTFSDISEEFSSAGPFSDSAVMKFRAAVQQMRENGSLSEPHGRRHSLNPGLLRRLQASDGSSNGSSGDEFGEEDGFSSGTKSMPLPIVRRGNRRSSAPAISMRERGVATSGASLRTLLSRPDPSPITTPRRSVRTPEGESKASLFRVDISKPEADGRFLGGHIDLVGQLDQIKFRNVQDAHCLDVFKGYGVHVVCIAKLAHDDSTSGSSKDEDEGEGKSAENAPGMNWTPGDTTQLRLKDRLYVAGCRTAAASFAGAVGTLHDIDEEIEWTAIPVPQHWVGWRLGRQTDERPKGLNLRVTCGATLLGLRTRDGTVDLFPDSNTELQEGQEMLFLHSLKSHPGAAFEFVFDPQLLDPERWRRLSGSVNSTLRGAVCGVCFDTLQGAECRKFACGHMFHSECVEAYIAQYNSCPLCRDKVWDWGRNAETKKWEVRDRTQTCKF